MARAKPRDVLRGVARPMYAFDPSAPQPSPLAEMLAVFSRPRREDDEPPEPIVSSGWSPEPSEAARAREDEAIESTLPLSYRLPLPGRATAGATSSVVC